jgi:hypothetical protein
MHFNDDMQQSKRQHGIAYKIPIISRRRLNDKRSLKHYLPLDHGIGNGLTLVQKGNKVLSFPIKP